MFILLYVTTPSEKEAQNISKHLLKQKLIACCNFFPVKSNYWWKGKIVTGKEFVLILKTTTEKEKEVRKEIEKIHSYKIPCILKLDVKPNPKFGEWMKEQL